MKIYCSKIPDVPNIDPELMRAIRQICNRDAWLAVREDDLYNKWIKAVSVNGELKFDSIYNTAWYPKQEVILRGQDADSCDLTAKDIHLDICELIKPVEVLSSEELAMYISSENNRFRFDPEVYNI